MYVCDLFLTFLTDVCRKEIWPVFEVFTLLSTPILQISEIYFKWVKVITTL